MGERWKGGTGTWVCMKDIDNCGSIFILNKLYNYNFRGSEKLLTPCMMPRFPQCGERYYIHTYIVNSHVYNTCTYPQYIDIMGVNYNWVLVH